MLEFIAGVAVGLVVLFFVICWIGKKDQERQTLEVMDYEDEIADDVCMCGDAMKNHGSAFDTGHSPISMRDHYTRGTE